MSLVKGLDAIRKAAEGRGKRTSRARFFKLNDGQSVKVRFLQELDESAAGFNKEAGLGVVAVEYRHPQEFQKRALDTIETEGKCWMAEQGWKPRSTLYIAVLIEDGEDAGEVRVLNQGFGPKSIVLPLVEFAQEFGTITDRPYRIKRTGTGMTDTQYLLTPLKEDAEPFDVTKYVEQLPNYEELLTYIPYEEQAAYFGGGTETDADETW